MTEDEIRYVCSVIPLQATVDYFKHYPKDFAKVMRGFRATSLKSHEQVSALLFRMHNQPFISSFVEKHISRWLEEISTAISKKTEDGESKESALMQTLPFCFFVDNIGLYFKLVQAEHTKEYISVLGTSIKMIKDSNSKREQMEATQKKMYAETNRLEEELESVQSKLNKVEKKLSDHFDEIKALKRTNADLEKLNSVIQASEQAIDSLKRKVQEREDYIQRLKDELSAARHEQQELEVKIREEIERQRAIKSEEQGSGRNPKCPKDIDDFKEYLGYNLENLGVPTNAEYYSLLKDYLSEILFQGKPIIVSKNTGMTLMQCVANALAGSPKVTTFTFGTDILEHSIDVFLSNDKRIVCLDNFIGNYNETILLTKCDKHRDKIIFLTVAYDRTLCYVPEEFLKYCYYINLNRIGAFTGSQKLTEDPSIIDEADISNTIITPDSRWSPLLKEILYEFGVSSALTAHKISLVSNEQSLYRLLAFDILPYCVDVLKIAPFNTSERLIRYAGDSGRCPYKDLFKRWFVR